MNQFKSLHMLNSKYCVLLDDLSSRLMRMCILTTAESACNGPVDGLVYMNGWLHVRCLLGELIAPGCTMKKKASQVLKGLRII